MVQNLGNDFTDKKICNAVKYAQRLLINTNFYHTPDKYLCTNFQTASPSRTSPRKARLSPKYNKADYSAKEKILIEIIYRLGKELKKCKSKRKKVSFHEKAKKENGNSLQSHSKKYRAITARTNRMSRSPIISAAKKINKK